MGVCLTLAGCGRTSRSGSGAGAGSAAGSGAAVTVGAAAAPASSADVAGLEAQTPPWPCTGWPRATVTAFDRASRQARAFGTVQAGDPVAVVARDPAGWLAFSPGVAQAANVGPFRLRWLPPDAQLRLEGSCDALPVRTSPPAGVCFEMAMAPTPIRVAPRSDAAVLTELQADGYVAITGRHPNGWLRVDAGSGSRPGYGSGWIAPQAVNVNGPCDAYLGPAPSP